MILSTVILLYFVISPSNAEKPMGIDLKNATIKSPAGFPQAFFYRTEQSNIRDNVKSNFLQDISALKNYATETTATTAEYEDNATTVQEEEFTSTVVYSNVTEFTDIPDISFFPKPPAGASTETSARKKKSNSTTQEYCDCDLTFHACDINCCCDVECTDEEKNIFSHCPESFISQDLQYCYSRVFHYKNNTPSKIHIEKDNLLCIIKDNVPVKRHTAIYHKLTDINEAHNLIKNFYKWPDNNQRKREEKFKAKSYTYGDPVWLLNDSNVSVLDVPFPYLSHYCYKRTPVRFLKNMEYKCIVRVAHLEMFGIYENANYTLLAGVPAHLQDQGEHLDVKNCSTVHCIQWLIYACDYENCELYNETKHNSSCDDSICVNIANKLKYVFHCVGSKISKAEVYLHLTNISTEVQFLQQEISVKYYLVKETTENTTSSSLDLSGNPGYIFGKPVIKVLLLDVEHVTDMFSNNTFPLRNVVSVPQNVAGTCILSNSTHSTINFGFNSNSNCRYSFQRPKQENNGTRACNDIQNEIIAFMGLDDRDKVMISPLGNPSLVQKEDWVELITDKLDGSTVHGEYQHQQRNTLLLCYNFVSAFSYEFTYANVSGPGPRSQSHRKILRSVVRYKDYERVEFDLEDNTAVVSTNVMFFDVTKPALYEYARGPQLYIHVPSDFFYPFTWNACERCQVLNATILIVIVSVFCFQSVLVF